MLVLIGREIVRKSKRKEKRVRKKEKSIRRKSELISNCARELEKVRNRLNKELSLIAKPEDLTQLLQRLIKEQSLQQGFSVKSDCWAAHLTIA